MKRNGREELIQNIKDCGQSLIDNAEQIAGNYKYESAVVITCYPSFISEAPHIIVETTFCPEKIIERFT